MQHLSHQTIRLLSSAQVITSVINAVKELLENALDAGADSIEIKLENFGLDRIEVRDNGSGIASKDVPLMGQRHYTSKISDFQDLATVTSYGFRGEALASLCAVADVSVTTKQECDEVSRLHVMNHNGEVTLTKPSHLGNGTTVCATNMFKLLPVRRQYYDSSSSRKKDELRKVTDLVMCYGYINPGVRLTLSHNKKTIWQKNKVDSCKMALLNTVGSNVMNQLVAVEEHDAETGVSLNGFLPRRGGDPQLIGRVQNDRCWMYINKRPVNLKDAEKLIKKSFSRTLAEGAPPKNITACVHFVLPTESVDVNLEPDKRKVLLQNKNAVLSLLVQTVGEVYAKPKTPTKSPQKKVGNSLSRQEDDKTNSINSQPVKSGKTPSRGNILPTLDENVKAKMNNIETNTASSNKGISEPLLRLPIANREDESDPLAKEALNSGTLDKDEPSFSFFDDQLFEDSQPVKFQQGGVALADCSVSDVPAGRKDSTETTCLDMATIIRNASKESTRDILDHQKRTKNGSIKDSFGESLGQLDKGQDNLDSSLQNSSTDQDALHTSNTGQTSAELINRGVSMKDWSKGVVLGTKATPVEPVKLLVPGSKPDTGDGDSRTPYINECLSGPDNGLTVQRHVPSRLPSEESGDERVGMINGHVKARDRYDRETMEPQLEVTHQISKNNGDLFSQSEAREKCTVHSERVVLDEMAEMIGPKNALDTRNRDNVISADVGAEEKPDKDLIEDEVSLNTNVVTKDGSFENAMSSDMCQTDTTNRKPADSAGGTSKNGSGSSSNKCLIPKVAECIPVKKPIVVAQSVSDDRQRPDKNLPVSIKKKPLPVSSSKKRKKTSKKTHEKSNQGLINEMLASQERRRSRLPPVTVKEVPFSTGSLSRFIECNTSHGKEDKNSLRLICKLQNHWIVLENSKLLLFNHFSSWPNSPNRRLCLDLERRIEGALHFPHLGYTAVNNLPLLSCNQVLRVEAQNCQLNWAEEVVLYHRLLANHVLPSVSLDVPIVLNKSMFSSTSCWLTLLSLKTGVPGIGGITEYNDERLVSNGFKVQRLIDKENQDIRLQITAIADLIPCYSHADLQELLSTISETPGIKLQKCRPLKVSNYLKGEAVRISRNRPPSISEEDALTLIAAVRKVGEAPSVCLHGKPLFTELCSLKK